MSKTVLELTHPNRTADQPVMLDGYTYEVHAEPDKLWLTDLPPDVQSRLRDLPKYRTSSATRQSVTLLAQATGSRRFSSSQLIIALWVSRCLFKLRLCELWCFVQS